MADNALTFSEEEIYRLFGHEAAEDEDPARLRQYYFKGSCYDQVFVDLPLRILVGHKGIGKSALFKVAIEEHTENNDICVLIRPDDIAELATDTSDFLKNIRDWKKGLSEIVANKVMNNLSKDTSNISGRILNIGGKLTEFVFSSLKDELFTVDPAKTKIVEKFRKNRKIYVYIDDLDRGWQGKDHDVHRISALLNAVRDLSAENAGLYFRIGLRSDVFFLVRTSDESTDKIEGSVIWLSWTNHENFVLLVKRIATYFGDMVEEEELINQTQSILDKKYLAKVFEPRFMGRGHWENAPIHSVLLSLVRKRPRDLVKLCTLAARDANRSGNSIIRTKNLENIFEEYSQGRLQDTINEFRSELPHIKRLLENMKPNKRERRTAESYIFTTAELLRKIGNISQMGAFMFANGDTATSKQLAEFMYKINFITARKDQEHKVIRKYFEENRYLSSQVSDFGFDWEIHPAYRWALQPDSPSDLFSQIRLSSE